jgi:hypothetical protein
MHPTHPKTIFVFSGEDFWKQQGFSIGTGVPLVDIHIQIISPIVEDLRISENHIFTVSDQCAYSLVNSNGYSQISADYTRVQIET